MITYRIKDWAFHFEKSQTRACAKMTWTPIPNKFDGTGYRKLLDENPMFYLVWVLLLGVAGKCKTRGTLADSDGAPLTEKDLAIKTGLPEKHFKTALLALCKIGWLEALHPNCNDAATTLQQHCNDVAATGQDRTGQDKTGQDSAPHAEMHAAWNALGSPFPKVASWTSGRSDTLRARWKDEFFRDNWRQALELLKASNFCRGTNDRGWIADIEFFLRGDSVAKIIEGKYANKTTATEFKRRGPLTDAELEEVRKAQADMDVPT